MDTDKDFALDSIEDAWEDRVRAYEAQGLTRSDAQAVVDAEDAACPPLAPEEHHWIEERVGRKLSNTEAQLALKDAKLAASWEWEAAKRRPSYEGNAGDLLPEICPRCHVRRGDECQCREGE